MIINDQLAPLTEAISKIYFEQETNVSRINAIVQFILERDNANLDEFLRDAGLDPIKLEEHYRTLAADAIKRYGMSHHNG